MRAKPHLRIVDGKPVEVPDLQRRVEEARRKFGRLFAHEPGSDYTPRTVSVLTEWQSQRVGAKKVSA